METTLKVKGMHCKSCEILLKDVIEEIGGVRATVDSVKGTIKVSCDKNVMDSIKKAIEKEGYKVVQ